MGYLLDAGIINIICPDPGIVFPLLVVTDAEVRVVVGMKAYLHLDGIALDFVLQVIDFRGTEHFRPIRREYGIVGGRCKAKPVLFIRAKIPCIKKIRVFAGGFYNISVLRFKLNGEGWNRTGFDLSLFNDLADGYVGIGAYGNAALDNEYVVGVFHISLERICAGRHNCQHGCK